MSFPAYPANKESGVEWLGEIPEHWSVLPVKWVGWLKGGTGFPHDKQGVNSHELDFHKVNALASADSDGVLRSSENTITRETAKELGAYVFPKGTIVFAKVGAALLLGRLRTIGAEACLDNNMMGLIAFKGKVSNQFVLYSMGTVRFDLIANPGAVPSLNEGQIGNYRLAIPGLLEQTQIARFLDHETARIDALIEEQQRLIELLKEKRQAVISHAVTKGLDPTVLMKDSGVEWLGEVPAHWGFGKIRYFAKIESGHTPSRSKPEYWENCTIPWFSLADVWQIRSGEVIELFETKELVSEVGLANSSARLLPKGTVVLSRTASVGYSAIMGCDMATTQDFANWICGSKLDNTFLLFCFRAMKSEFDRLMVGSTHKTIYMPDIAGLVCSVPPPDEQGEIAAHIKISNSKFGDMIDEAERMKKLLSERRSALISAAVTGKIDVRGWRPPANAQILELTEEAV